MTIKQSQQGQNAATAPNGATVTPLPRSDATMQRQFDELSAELCRARKDAAQLIELLAEANARLTDVSATANDRTREVAAAVSELEALRASNADLRGHVQRLTKQCGELTSDLRDRENVLTTMISNLEKARGEAADRDQQIMALSEALTTTRTELRSSHARSEELAQALETATARLEELATARNEAAAKANELGRARDAAMRRVAEQAALFQTRMRDAQAASRDAQKVARADFEALKDELACINTERDALALELNLTREEIVKLQSDLDGERALSVSEQERMAVALAAAHARNASVEQQYADLRQRFVLFVQRATAMLRSDVVELAQSIDEIQGGRIWRVKRAIGRLRK